MSSLYNINKLDGSNYDTWSVQMMSVLTHQDLWEVTSGDLIKPNEDEEKATWQKLNNKAKSVIILSVAPSEINSIKRFDTAKEIWDTLQDIHRPTGPVRKVSLFKRLLNLRMNENGDVQQHLSNFFDISEKLTETGIELNEELIVIMLLASLPSSFENFVVALESRDELPKLKMIKIKLLEESERRAPNDNSNEVVQAFVAKTKERYNKPTKPIKIKKDVKCYKCGKVGHYAFQCKAKRLSDRNHNHNENATSYAAFVAIKNYCNQYSWCIDSGATTHMCSIKNLFDFMNPHNEKIELAGKHFINANGIGDISLNMTGNRFILKDVLYVPDIQCNFISVARAVKNGCNISFNKDFATIKNGNKELIRAKNLNNLYLCEIRGKQKLNSVCNTKNELMKWHERYGHLNIQSLKELKDQKLVHGLKFNSKDNFTCIPCLKSKCTVKPFHKSERKSNEILEMVHTDVCGPINKNSIGGSKYFVTMIDDMSKYVNVYFIKNKSEVFNVFKNYVSMVERQTGNKLKILRSDNGTEYINKEFDKYLQEKGIKRQLSVPYTPEQNGVAERFNRTLVEMARAMMVNAGLGEQFWAEAVACAAYLRNRSPSKALDKATPYEIWTGQKPVIKHLKIFGSLAIALNKTEKKKFCAKGKEYIMVGYSDTSKAYRLYDQTKEKVIISRDVYFNESILGSRNKLNTEDFFISEIKENNKIKNETFRIEDLLTPETITNNRIENIENETWYETANYLGEESEAEDEQQLIEDQEGGKSRKGPGRPKIIRTGLPGRPRKQYNIINLANSETVEIPNSVKQALKSKQSIQWREAMKAEYDALLKNETWTVVNLPENKKPVGCKWVFTLKKDKAGEIERYKARLVAKGYGQTYGIDYTETFSPVVRYATMRLVLALAAEYKLYVHQIDVTTAYLNGELEEEVYMKPPECFEESPNQVLKLNKSLYGLKQSGRVWNQKLDKVLRGIGYKACESEPCLYTMNSNNKINMIAVYVDDLLIACSNLDELKDIKLKLAENFNIKDQGPLNHFLGFEIERDGDTGSISINQKQRILKILKDFKMEECRKVTTPLEVNYQVNCNNKECRRADKTIYQSLIGSIMYIAIGSRPDILHSACKLSQKNTDPHSEHLEAAKHILRYLYATIDLKLIYKQTGKGITGYVDADWAGDPTDRKSFTGYAFFLGGTAFSWECKKQNSVALSSTEAEYMAMSAAAKEAIFLRKILNESNLNTNGNPINIYGDNLSAIQLVKNSVYHARSKHIDIRYHHIRECYEKKLIELIYCQSNQMIADVLTKNLSKINHNKFVNMLGLK